MRTRRKVGQSMGSKGDPKQIGASLRVEVPPAIVQPKRPAKSSSHFGAGYSFVNQATGVNRTTEVFQTTGEHQATGRNYRCSEWGSEMTQTQWGLRRGVNIGRKGITAIVAMMAMVLVLTQVALAANPAPAQIYYVPVDEDDALLSLDTINGATVSPISSYVSLSIGTDYTIIYYDQWEDNFLANMANTNIYSLANPSGTQIWGNGESDDGCPPNIDGKTALSCSDANDKLMAGNVVVLNSSVNLTDDPTRAVIDFDGGDKIGATEQIAVSRIFWGAGSNTLSAGAIEVYPTNSWGTTYQVPVGEEYAAATGSLGTISYVGGTTNTTGSSSGTDVALTPPTGIATNDLMIAVLTWNANSPAMSATPAGWTLLRSGTRTNGNDPITQRVYWKRATASDTTSSTYTWSTSSNTTQRIGSLTAYRNAGIPVASDSANENNANATAPAIAYQNGYWVDFVSSIAYGATSTPPTGATERTDARIGNTSTGMAQTTATTSFTGSGTTTNNSNTWSSSANWIAMNIAIPPTGYTQFSNLSDEFQYASVSIQATADGTTVTVDRDGAVSALGNETFTLDEGESVVVNHVFQGATITGNHPIQVDLLTGDIGSNYEYSAYTLLPKPAWGNSYWSPVSGKLGDNSDYETQITIYNPDQASAINVRCEFYGGTGSSTQSIPANGLGIWATPANSGAHCFTVTAAGGSTQDPNGKPFFMLGTVDAAYLEASSDSGAIYDWGYTGEPDGQLDTQALVGLGNGHDPGPDYINNTENGSPVWVTAACKAPATSTWVYVDFNGDGSPDDADLNGDNDTNDTVNGVLESSVHNGVQLSTLQSIRFFDKTDYSQTGAQIYSLTGQNNSGVPGCLLSVAWGEDPGVASQASPGFDVGTTVPPLVSLSISKTAFDVDGDAYVTPGNTLLYTITVKNTSKFGSFDSVLISDTVPAGTTYVAGSTVKNIGSGSVSIPDSGSGTAFPLDDSGGVLVGSNLLPLASWTVSFKVTIDPNISCDASVENTAYVNGIRNSASFTRQALATTNVDCMASLIVEKKVVGPDTPPGFDFTLVSSATLPSGVLPSSLILTPPTANGAISTTISVPAGVYTVTEQSESNWTLTNVSCTGTTGTGNLANRRARYVLPEKGTVKCTWTNTEDTGVIKVVKDVVPDAPTTNWVFTKTGTGPTAFNGTIAGDGNFTRTVGVGTYGLTETAGNGTDLSLYNTTYSCTAANPSATTVTGTGRVLTGINVVKGQTWTCTYTNTRKTGNLVIQKVGKGGNDTFSYVTTGGVGDFNISTTGYVAGSSDSSGNKTFNNLATGTYTIDESTLPAGWDFTSLTCSSDTGTSVSGTKATIGLDEGDNVTCTFTNTKRGSLKVTKTIDWNGLTADPSQVFTICVNGPSLTNDCQNYSQATSLEHTYTNLVPGNYTVSESSPTSGQGWVITVTPGNPTVVAGQQTSVTVNNKREQGKLVITKTVNPTFTRSYDWQIKKVVSPATVNLFDGQSGTLNWTIQVTRSAAIDTAHRLTGTVTIQNNGTSPAMISSVVDKLANGTSIALTCPTLPATVAAGASIGCTYDKLLNPDAAITSTNWVTVTTSSNQVYTGTAPVAFGLPLVTNRESINISDSNGQSGTATGNKSYSYSTQVNCSNLTIADGGSASFNNLNTATITETGQQAQATAAVNCYRLKVEKSANTALTRTWDWDIYKVVTPTSATLYEDQSQVLAYTVGVTNNGSTDSAWSASGLITVTNPAPMAASLSSLTDKILNGSTVVTAPVPSCANLTVPAGGKLSCSYASSLPSAATLNNQAVAILAGKNYTGSAAVSFANPKITKVNESIHVTDSYTTTVWPFSTSGSVDYDRTANCQNVTWGADGRATYNVANKAQITENGESANVTVPVTCIKYGTITVKKVTVPSTATDKFTFTGDLSGSIGNNQTISKTVVPGTYTVSETVPAGWTLTSIACSDSNSTWTIPTTTFAVEAGENVTCTYTNTKGLAQIYFDPPTATNAVNVPHAFTVFVKTSIDGGATWQPVNSQVVTGTLVAGSVGSLTTPTCTTNAAGSCQLTVSSAVAGSTQLNAKATVNVLGLPTLVQTAGTSNTATTFQNAVKTWVNLRVRIDPQTATNPLNLEHTFTISVTQNLGNGWVPVANGVTGTVTIAPQPAGFTLVSNTCATPGTVNGICTVKINSGIAQVYTANVSVTTKVAGQSITRSTLNDAVNIAAGGSDGAEKTYREGALDITKSVKPSYTKTFDWTIQKDVNPAALDLFDGQKAPVTYTVTLVKDAGTNSLFQIAGAVVFSNTSDSPVIINNPVDKLGSGATVSLNCGSVTFPYTIAGYASLTCSYLQTFAATQTPDSLDTTNNVTVTTTSGSTFTETVPVDFGSPTTLVNDKVAVTDTNTTTVWSNIGSSQVITYSQNIDCNTQTMTQYVNGKATGSRLNTAGVDLPVGTDKSDTANVDVACYRLAVSKNALPTLTRTWDWDIDKAVSKDTIHLNYTDSEPITYTLSVTNLGSTDSAWAATGVVTVSNPAPMVANLTSLTDALSDATPVTFNCGTTVPAAASGKPGTLVCGYSATMTDGDALVNTATAVAYSHSYSGTADVNFANATVTKVNESVTVTDTNVSGQVWGPYTTSTKIEYPYVADCSNATLVGEVGHKTIHNQADIVETDDSDTQDVNVDCTQNPTLTVIKVTDPLSNTTPFKFTTSWDAGFSLNGASGTNTYHSGPLTPGVTYSFTETVPAEWDLINVSCKTDKVVSLASFAAGEADPMTSVTLQPAEDVVCTYTNKANNPPSIEVTKTASSPILPNPGGIVTFTVDVKNSSIDDTLILNTLVDSIYGNLLDLTDPTRPELSTTCALPQTLAVGQVYSCNFTASLMLDSSSTVGINETNVVTGTGTSTDDDDKEPVKDSDDANVQVPCQGGDITGVVFYDPNGNDVLNAGEGPFKGNPAIPPAQQIEILVELQKVDSSGNVIDSLMQLTTNGKFTFSNVAKGFDYTLRVGDAALSSFGYQPSGSSLDFDATPYTCVPYIKNFGYNKANALVGDYVWYDANVNKLQDEWFDANGDGAITTNTGTFNLAQWEFIDFNGNNIADLPEELNTCAIGSVSTGSSTGPVVTITGPTPQARSRGTGSTGYYRDSNIFTGNNEGNLVDLSQTGTYTLTIGKNDPMLSVGRLWYLGRQGQPASCKPIPAGNSITPNLPSGGAPLPYMINFDDGFATTSDASVSAASHGVLSAAALATAQCGLTTSDKDTVNMSNVPSHVYLDADFGTVCTLDTATIGDRVWQDINPNATDTPGRLAGDGLQNDPSEQGIAGITVNLWAVGNDGLAGTSDDVLVDTQVTDSNGNYQFTGVMPGDYYLEFVDNSGNGGWSSNPDVGSNNNIDSDVRVDSGNPTRATTGVVQITAGQNDLSWDAALVTTDVEGSSDIGDLIWNDTNKNGIQDNGESGKPGVVVELWQIDPNGGPDIQVGTTTTDANGNYLFGGLDPGSYYIVVNVPNGFTVSPQDAGTNDGVDSDVAPNGHSSVIVLPGFTSNLTVDAGIYPTPTADPIPNEPLNLKMFLPTVSK